MSVVDFYKYIILFAKLQINAFERFFQKRFFISILLFLTTKSFKFQPARSKLITLGTLLS